MGPFCHNGYDTCVGCKTLVWTRVVSGTYRLHSAHETSPRARLRRSSDSDMVLMDATRVLVADVEADVAMGNEEGTCKCSHG